MTPVNTESLQRFLDDALGGSAAITVTPLTGGGSCEAFAIDRGSARWVLRRAPRHANAASAHDVLREYRILDAIKDTPVPIARPIVSCADPAVFGAPFFVMERIDGSAILSHIPERVGDGTGVTGSGARGAHRRARRDPRRRLAGLRSRRPGPHRRVPATPDHAVARPARVLRRPRASERHPSRRLARFAPTRRPAECAVSRRLQARQRALRPGVTTQAGRGRRLGDGRRLATRSSTSRGRSSSTRDRKAPSTSARRRTPSSPWTRCPIGAS